MALVDRLFPLVLLLCDLIPIKYSRLAAKGEFNYLVAIFLMRSFHITHRKVSKIQL